jgi:hypothetical protein
VPPDFRWALEVMSALIFFSAAAGKMRNWPTFRGVVANYRLLPDFLVAPVACLLPPLEAAIGVGLLTPWASPWAARAAAAMFTLFATAMAVNLTRGRRAIDCGCFQNALKQTLRWRLVARNVAVALLLLLASADGARPMPLVEPAYLVNGLLGGAALFVVWQALNTLWSIE